MINEQNFRQLKPVQKSFHYIFPFSDGNIIINVTCCNLELGSVQI